ncbi:excalibur calcium-binding domain-containing protein [Sphingomonas sp. H160509]|nr:excalibur calcium-binding domain-containing protein [Sphingomonas sp. H160509]
MATGPPLQPAPSRKARYSTAGAAKCGRRGAAPLHRGQPGYRAGMDGDGDGIACENYR